MLNLTYNQAINRALHNILSKDENTLVWGPGAVDPKRVFGTTENLFEEFGKERVIDGAISEAFYTGHGLGLALSGLHPIIHYQRIDFSFMAWDQIVNNISKWSRMFGEAIETPIIIRAIVGRGWGQGQQHSQNPIQMLTSFPGLKVYTPTSPLDVYSCLHHAHKEREPSLILEHRWLQGFEMSFSQDEAYRPYREYTEGDDLTLVSYSYGVVECLRAQSILKDHGVNARVIGLNQVSSNLQETLTPILENSKKSLLFDLTWSNSSLLASKSPYCKHPDHLVITLPNDYTPTSIAMTKHYYPDFKDIVLSFLPELSKEEMSQKFVRNFDQPLYDDIFNPQRVN